MQKWLDVLKGFFVYLSGNQSTASSYCRLLPVNNILVDVTVSVTVVTCITRNLMLAIIPIFSYSSSKVREVRGVACLRQNHLFAPYTLTLLLNRLGMIYSRMALLSLRYFWEHFRVRRVQLWLPCPIINRIYFDPSFIPIVLRVILWE